MRTIEDIKKDGQVKELTSEFYQRMQIVRDTCEAKNFNAGRSDTVGILKGNEVIRSARVTLQQAESVLDELDSFYKKIETT